MGKKQIIKTAVDRFLGWKLPEGFSPDCGIEFKRFVKNLDGSLNRIEPVGTNLFTAEQAQEMFEHCLRGLLPLEADAYVFLYNDKTQELCWPDEITDYDEHSDRAQQRGGLRFVTPLWAT